MRIKRTVKRVVFSLVPLVALFTAAEAVVRVRYFLVHGRDWNYITMPFSERDRQHRSAGRRPTGQVLPSSTATASSGQRQPPPAPSSAPVPSTPASGGQIQPVTAAAPSGQGQPSPAPSSAPRPSSTTASRGPMEFKAVRPCRDLEIFSDHYNKPMPYTWDANCFRGDPVQEAKPPGEIRLFVLGGSTVQDDQPDIDMWTRRLKEELGHPQVRVVNAGKAGMNSETIADLYTRKISRFAADVVLYYEAWNEQIGYLKWHQIDHYISSFKSWWHDSLYYKSAVYTYLVEKYSFRTQRDVGYFRIDLKRLERNLKRLSREVQESGSRFVFVTQVTNFPRYWKGIDTFQPEAVEALLDRLGRDPAYTYDTYEISALNQRLALLRSVQLCRALNVPVVDILADLEALGEAGRAPLFRDLGHLTWQGDRLVGHLVAKQLMALNVLDARATPEMRREPVVIR